MNIYIPISILLMAMFFITFKLFERFNVDAFQSITFNYLTACLLSFISNYHHNIAHISLLPGCLKGAIPIGILFISVFNLSALITRRNGVTIASLLNKLSMVIPIAAGIVLYCETLDAIKITGIIFALIAVYMTAVKPSGAAKNTPEVKIFLLIIFFIGSGLVDTAIKYVQAKLMTESNKDLYVAAMFGSAAVAGFLKIFFDYLRTRKVIEGKNIAGGILLGIFNYYSLIFVIKALEMPGAKSSVTFAILNIGVLLCVAISGVLFFNEKFSPISYAGLLLALLSIVMLSQ